MDIEAVTQEDLDVNETLAKFGQELGVLRSNKQQLVTLRKSYIARLEEIDSAKTLLIQMMDEEMLYTFPDLASQDIDSRDLAFYKKLASEYDEALLIFNKYSSDHVKLDQEAADLTELHKKNLEEEVTLTEKEAKLVEEYKAFAEKHGETNIPDLEAFVNSYPDAEELSVELDAKVLAIIMNLQILDIHSQSRLQTMISEDNQFVASDELKKLVQEGVASEDSLKNDQELKALVSAEAKPKSLWWFAGAAALTYMILG